MPALAILFMLFDTAYVVNWFFSMLNITFLLYWYFSTPAISTS